MWAETRLVSKTATVSLLGNSYEVDQALCGRRVELRFDPYDLQVIEVYHAGRRFGHAVPHRVGRHVHPQAQEPAGQERPATGIDYLRLIADQHERDWLSRQINYHELLSAEGELTAENSGDAGNDDDDDEGGAALAASTVR